MKIDANLGESRITCTVLYSNNPYTRSRNHQSSSSRALIDSHHGYLYSYVILGLVCTVSIIGTAGLQSRTRRHWIN